ncbi:hypothetical protein LTR74_018767, partial [Friedmanniomyces endolithicus]
MPNNRKRGAGVRTTEKKSKTTEKNIVYCIIEVISAPIVIGSLPQNELYILDPGLDVAHKRSDPYRYSARKDTPQLGRVKLQLTIDKATMRHPNRGHIFGSDASTCDILLDTTVANCIFRMELSTDQRPPAQIDIVNLSKTGSPTVDNLDYWNGDRAVVSKGQTSRVEAGPNVIFSVEFPDRGLDESALDSLREAGKAPLADFHAIRAPRKSRMRTPTWPHSFQNWVRVSDIPWKTGKKYNITGQLGRGRYSTVRMATESQTGRFVAVKIITDGVSPPVKLSRVEDKSRELDIMRRLRRNPHPNIVERLDHAEYPTEPHPTLLVLEFAAHGTLLEYHSRSLDSSPCNKEQTAKEITLQIIKATKHLHDMNIIHGDISPSNVLVFEFDDSDITPYCKLADFTHAQDFIIGNRPGGPDCF